MELPSKHHFIPAFSLKPWTGADGKVCQMRKIGGKVISCSRHPNATGFERDLYRIEGVGAERSQHLETEFFKPLDTEAARALQKILSRDMSLWDAPARSAWTRYILSLMFRVPAVVDAVKNHFSQMWKVSIRALEADYDNRRLPTDPTTFAEYCALTHQAAPEIGAANMLMQIIDNDRVGPTIFNMHWFPVPLPNANVELLYSDRPIDRPKGLDDLEAYIALPVSPRLLFVAAKNINFAKELSEKSQTKIVKAMNKVVVSQAREFVWGSDATQLCFVKKYIASVPERDLLSPEQKAQAIALAMGRNSSRLQDQPNKSDQWPI